MTELAVPGPRMLKVVGPGSMDDRVGRTQVHAWNLTALSNREYFDNLTIYLGKGCFL